MKASVGHFTPKTLASFSRLHSDAEGPFTLYQAESPEGDVSYFLYSKKVSNLNLPPRRRVTIKLSKDRDQARDVNLDVDYNIVASRKAKNLLDLIFPIKRKGFRSPDFAVFLFKDQGELAEIVEKNLNFANDRMEYATIESAGETFYALRIQSPSFYILEEGKESSAEVYEPSVCDQALVPLGMELPLSEYMTHNNETVLFSGSNIDFDRRSLGQVAWTDIYLLTEFSLDRLSSNSTWSEGASPNKIDIRLSLRDTHEVRDSTLWLLPISAMEKIEGLVRTLPEDEVDKLQFSVQTSEDGESFLFMREKFTGDGRQHLSFGGLELATFAGYPNFYTPSNRRVFPTLRKDRYKETFGLKKGMMTIFFDTEDGDHKVVHVKENSFSDISTIVKYLLSKDAERLKSFKSNVALEFLGFTRRLPLRERVIEKEVPVEKIVEVPVYRDGSGPVPVSLDVETMDLDEVIPEDIDLPTEEEATSNFLTQAPEVLSDFEIQEKDLENQIVAEGSDTKVWIDLAKVKMELGKPEEASICFLEALWVAEGGEETEEVNELFDSHLRSVQPYASVKKIKGLRSQYKHDAKDPLWFWKFLRVGSKEIKKDLAKATSNGSLQSWLDEAKGHMDSHGEFMRKKDLWLFAQEVVSLNGDVAFALKIREEIQTRLNEEGLRQFEIPSFILARIHESSVIEQSDDEGSDFGIAKANIQTIKKVVVDTGKDAVLAEIANGLLAFCYARLGEDLTSKEHFDLAEASYNKMADEVAKEGSGSNKHIVLAWFCMYLGAALEVHKEGLGKTWFDRYNGHLQHLGGGSTNRMEIDNVFKGISNRINDVDPSAAFDPNNFRGLYPGANDFRKGQSIKSRIVNMINDGHFRNATSEIESTINTLSKPSTKMTPSETSWLIGELIDLMMKTGYGSEALESLKRIEDTVPAIEGKKTQNKGLYSRMSYLSLARGFFHFGDERHAEELLCEAVETSWKSEKPLNWLDLLDFNAAAMMVAEVSPMARRAKGLEQIVNALHYNRAHKKDRHSYRSVKIRLLDHMIEVAMSKDKLMLELVKTYTEDDEFLIRSRLNRDIN